MHELAIARSILDIIAEEARAQGFCRVTKIRLAIGALATVEPDALTFGFEAVSRGTEADGAALDIERPPGRGRCARCGERWALRERGEACPACGGYRVLVTGGDELRVIDLEVE